MSIGRVMTAWLLLVTKTRSDDIWREGGVVQLVVQSNGSYSVSVGGEEWLRSFANLNALFAKGKWNQLQLEGTNKWNGSTVGLGQFSALSLRFQTTGSDAYGSIPLVNTFKYYVETDLFLFETMFPQGATGMAQGKPGGNPSYSKVHSNRDGHKVKELWSSNETSTRFPLFDLSDKSRLHTLGYIEWHGRFCSDSNSYGVGLGSFKGGTEGGPLVLFDTAGEVNRSRSHAIMISSFNNFKHAIATRINATLAGLAFGIQSYVTDVVPGFTLQFGLSGSAYGINDAVESWGAKLRALYGTKRISPSFDPTNTKLGYWTDNGAYYCSAYWSQHPQAVPQDVLIQVKQGLDRMDVPIGYIQLDPWWFPDNNGCMEWIPQENLFPKGLPWLSEQLGIPLLLYAYYFSVNNSYIKRDQFDFIESVEYQVSFAHGPIANINPIQSFHFYDYIMSQHNESMGAYEVDFLDFDFLPFMQLQQQVDAAEMWMKGMADAAINNNVSIQLCMELPSDLLQSVKFSAITNARASEDDFPNAGNRWNIAMTAMLMRALDIGPFFDDIWTEADEPRNPYNVSCNDIRMRTFVSALSGGPVGISDGVNLTDPELIMKSCRGDGVLLKPSKPIVPLDAHFMPAYQGGVKAGNIWNTHSQIGSYMWYHVMAFDVTEPFTITTSHLYPLKMTSNRPGFLIGEWGFPGCANGSLATQCLKPFDDSHPFTVQTPGMKGSEHHFTLYSISPILSNGWVLLGEVNKVVAVSPQRFVSVEVYGDGVRVRVSGKPSEPLVLWFVTSGGRILVANLHVPSSGQQTASIS